jgi:uncharacterized ubiquitin-like protein YukD
MSLEENECSRQKLDEQIYNGEITFPNLLKDENLEFSLRLCSVNLVQTLIDHLQEILNISLGVDFLQMIQMMNKNLMFFINYKIF